MANTLTKIYNSTLGIPQQVLLRLLRKMKNGDVNIFDEEGLLDGALIPFLGVFDDHTHAAYGSDFTDDAWGAFAIDVFADPTTYMTAGLTASGKLSAALKKLGNQKGMEKVKKELLDPDSSLTVAEVLDRAKKVRGNSGKEGLKMNPHIDVLEEAAGADNVGKIINSTEKEALMWGIPGLTKYGVSSTWGIGKHTSWFKWMGEKGMVPAAKLFSMFPYKHVPGFEHIAKVLDNTTNAVSSFGKGLRSPITPGLEIGYKGVSKADAAAHHAAINDKSTKIRQHLSSLSENKTAASSIYKSWFSRLTGTKSIDPRGTHFGDDWMWTERIHK